MTKAVPTPTDPSHTSDKLVNRRGVLLGSATLAVAGAAAPALAGPITCADAQADGIWWNELVADNPEQARAFYAKVAGWTTKIVAVDDNSRPPLPGEEEYTLFLQNGQEVAGLTKTNSSETGNPPPGWFTYVQVASVETAVTEALKTGGKVVRFPVDVAKVGRLAIIEDPSGAMFGVVAPAPSTPG